VKNNILIDNNSSARIADFGLTSALRKHSMSISITAPTCGGTLRWMAPELFTDNPHPSKASDVYALGMVIYEVGFHRILRVISPNDRPCRFSHTKNHSLGSLLTLYLAWSSPAHDPRDHQIWRFLASGTMSGCLRKSAGTGTRPSGHTSQISFPSLRQLPAVGSP